MEFEVIVGTYEQLILGYNIVQGNQKYEMVNSFTDHSHVGIVRCVTISEKGILASGSSDEAIKLFNLRKRRELGTLMHHEGSINQIAFHGKDSMFSCSDDGTLGIWKITRWECIRTLRGHKGAVYSVSVHPSGKMALSVSQDRTMRTWNLLTGKCAFVNKLKLPADFVEWTPEADHYFVVSNMTADLYSVETAKVVKSLNCGFKIHAIVYLGSDLVAIAGDKGIVQFYTIPDGKKVFEFSTDTIRIKGMQVCTKDPDDSKILITGSSDGFIKVWSLKQTKGSWSVDLIASTDTKFRIVSLAVRMCPNLGSKPDSISEETEEGSEEVQSDDDLDSNTDDSDSELDEDSIYSGSDGDVELDSDMLAELEELNEDLNAKSESDSDEEDATALKSTKHKHSPQVSETKTSTKKTQERKKTNTIEQSRKSKSAQLKKNNNSGIAETIQPEGKQLSKNQKKKLRRRAVLAEKKAEKRQVGTVPAAVAGKKRKQQHIKQDTKKKRKQ